MSVGIAGLNCDIGLKVYSSYSTPGCIANRVKEVCIMTISRRIPPMVAQTKLETCWAAALESWSLVDPLIPHRKQADLVRIWGEGAAGGITPQTKIPIIAAAMGLGWGGFQAVDLVPYIQKHLPDSHIFCAYTRGHFTHAVLIYRISDHGNISFMDPDGGRDRWHPVTWFTNHGPYALMRKR
jgi:hypothetical protein